MADVSVEALQRIPSPADLFRATDELRCIVHWFDHPPAADRRDDWRLELKIRGGLLRDYLGHIAPCWPAPEDSIFDVAQAIIDAWEGWGADTTKSFLLASHIALCLVDGDEPATAENLAELRQATEAVHSVADAAMAQVYTLFQTGLEMKSLSIDDARNKFCYELWQAGHTYKEILLAVKSHPKWEQFSTPLAVRVAIKAWARKNNLPIRRGIRGRRPKAR